MFVATCEQPLFNYTMNFSIPPSKFGGSKFRQSDCVSIISIWWCQITEFIYLLIWMLTICGHSAQFPRNFRFLRHRAYSNLFDIKIQMILCQYWRRWQTNYWIANKSIQSTTFRHYYQINRQRDRANTLLREICFNVRIIWRSNQLPIKLSVCF